MRTDDLTRELAKVLEALRWTEKHLMATNEGNAALHCNPKVFYSPLTTQVHEAVLSLERVTADLGSEDTLQVASHLEAAERAQQEIERLRGVAGRAYLLADRWSAAHGSAMFLVRAAGSELRDELDGPGPTGIRGLLEHVGIDTQGRDIAVGGRLVDAAGPEPDDWVTEECPHCEELLPRNRLDEHVVTAHADVPRCTATLSSDHSGLLHCVFRAGHREGEYGSHHASKHGPMGRTVWADWAKGATPHQPDDMDDLRQHYPGPGAQPCTKHRGRAERQRYGCNGPDPADQAPLNQGVLSGIEVRDPCPYCEDCRLVPRALMADHIREQHPEVTVASHANGTTEATDLTPRQRAYKAVNEYVAPLCLTSLLTRSYIWRAVNRALEAAGHPADPEAQCRLPHEMEG